MKVIAAIDQGTTSSRCILFDHAGVVASAQKEHRQIFPRPGWVEHDAGEIWANVCAVIGEAMKKARGGAGVTGKDIAAVGITNQRETVVAWNRWTGVPYHNAIVWQDTRTADVCAAMSRDDAGVVGGARGADRFRAATGLPISTYFSATKIKWLLDNVRAFREGAEKGEAVVGTIDAWLQFNLSAEKDAEGDARYPRTDVTNASRTMLMRLETQNWDDELCAAFGVPKHILPVIAPSFCEVPLAVTDAKGPFGAEVPVSAILGDQQAALFGQTCFAVGECKNTYGTGNFLLMHTGKKAVASRHGLLTTAAATIGDVTTFALEGSVAVTGSLVQWMRDNLGLFEKAADIEKLAASVPDSGGVVIVPAFSGLFAPYWRSDARGTICGVTRFTTKAHLARAALEAVAMQTRDVIGAMVQDAGAEMGELKVDGGMTGNDLLLQIQADVLGLPVLRPKITETTALGAAYAAGLAAGYWKSQEELRTQWKLERRFEPAISKERREEMAGLWKKGLERSLGWV